MSAKSVEQLQKSVDRLEDALQLILDARSRGHGIHYCEGVAGSALEHLQKAQEKTS
tara:strand:- start:65201 stop:65368 length:168 start_codon:yes stop_codon:yes gene_type:complete